MSMNNFFNKQSIKILSKLANQGWHGPSQIYAKHLLNNFSSTTDVLHAVKYLEAGLSNKSSKASYSLAVIMGKFDFVFLEKYGKQGYQDKILKLLKFAAEKNHPQAQHKLAMSYWLGDIGLTLNNKLAHDWLLKAARNNNADAFCSLGVMHLTGDLDHKDLDRAFRFFKAAETLGSFNASCYIAEMYTFGEHVAKDLEQAFKYYQHAALNNSSQGAYQLARCYDNGAGTNKNIKQAFVWYNNAYELGSTAAKLRLAEFYIHGQVVKKNPIKAELLLKSVAQQGDPIAQFKLGSFYDTTTSNLKNHKRAHKWYLKAAKQNYTKAQINLAALSLRGEGIVQSEDTAKFWLEVAARSGDQIAIYNLEQLKISKIEDLLESAFGVDKVVH